MNTEDFLQQVMERRQQQGLRLAFITPDRPEPFVCYPKDESQKQRYLASAKRQGWVLAN
jgi:hypothetical protein